MKNKNNGIFQIFLVPVLLLITQGSSAGDAQQARPQTSGSCQELKEDLLALGKEQTECRHQAGKWEAGLNEYRKYQDALTAGITNLAGGAIGLLTIDQSKVCDKEALKKDPNKLDTESKIACMNLALGEVQKKMAEAKKYFEQFQAQEKDIQKDIVAVQKRMKDAGCQSADLEEFLLSATEATQTGQTTSQQTGPVGAGGAAFHELVYDLLDLADETPNINMFVGKWSGTVKVISSNEPSVVGATQPYVLEISKTDSGISLKSSAGIIGNPALYQTKMDKNHLRVDYSGLYETPWLPQAESRLIYWLDVTINGNSLTGQTYTQANSSYEGYSAEKRFLMTVELKR